MTRWWMSFADTSRPQGSQFLGVVIVEAADPAGATKKAWALGINPGGQIQATALYLRVMFAAVFDGLKVGEVRYGGPRLPSSPWPRSAPKTRDDEWDYAWSSLRSGPLRMPAVTAARLWLPVNNR